MDVEQHTILEVACLITDGDLEKIIEVRPLSLPYQLNALAQSRIEERCVVKAFPCCEGVRKDLTLGTEFGSFCFGEQP